MYGWFHLMSSSFPDVARRSEKFQGSLSDLSAPQLGAIAVREAVSRANIDPQQVDECIMGNVVSAGLGQNPRASRTLRWTPSRSSAMTINKVCGSGLKAVASPRKRSRPAIVPSWSPAHGVHDQRALSPTERAQGYRLGNGQLIDSMVHDGLWDIYNDYHMGLTGENVAEKYAITREEQDEFAVNSHRKAIAAQKRMPL